MWRAFRPNGSAVAPTCRSPTSDDARPPPPPPGSPPPGARPGSSPALGRAVATGAAIAEATGAPAKTSPALHDIDYGQWQWKTHEEVRETWPALFRLWFDEPQLVRFPGGEALQDLVARAGDALRLVVEAGPGETVVLVGHDSVGRALLMQLIDQPLSAYWKLALSPCEITEVDIEGGRIRVLRVNETAHLEALGEA